jgi:hypothetical protein
MNLEQARQAISQLEFYNQKDINLDDVKLLLEAQRIVTEAELLVENKADGALEEKTEKTERAGKGMEYYFVDITGELDYNLDYEDEFDDWRYLTGNYFLTGAAALEYNAYLQALGEITQYRREVLKGWGWEEGVTYYYPSFSEGEWEVSWTPIDRIQSLGKWQTEEQVKELISKFSKQMDVVRNYINKNN